MSFGFSGASRAMARTEIRLTVMAAEELKKTPGWRKRSVYTMVWIDPSQKQSTRLVHRGGRNPVWNDEILFSLGENVLLFPHSTLTIQVMRQGRKKDRLIGITYLPLAEIARIKAMNENPEDIDIVQLPLSTPSGELQGYISLSISLIDKSERSSVGASLSSNQTQEPVMGYPVGQAPNMAYYNATPYQSTSYEVPQQGPYVSSFQAPSGRSEFPVPTQPAGAVLYYPPTHDSSSPYVQAPQFYGPYTEQRTGRQRRGNMALALLGGAISGLVLGDILGAVF